MLFVQCCYAVTWETACSIQLEKLFHEIFCVYWTFDPSDYLHKYKMVARDSMLGDLISTCLS